MALCFLFSVLRYKNVPEHKHFKRYFSNYHTMVVGIRLIFVKNLQVQYTFFSFNDKKSSDCLNESFVIFYRFTVHCSDPHLKVFALLVCVVSDTSLGFERCRL